MESVRIGKCQNQKVLDSDCVKIRKCQIQQMSELVKFGKGQNLTSLEFVRNCLNLKASETSEKGKCQRLVS